MRSTTSSADGWAYLFGCRLPVRFRYSGPCWPSPRDLLATGSRIHKHLQLPAAALIAFLSSLLLSGCSATAEPPPVPPIAIETLLPDWAPHVTASIRTGDLVGDDSLQIFVAEPQRNQVVWFRGPDDWTEITKGMKQPVRSQVVDLDGDGDPDLLVADIGELFSVNDKVGRVVLARNNGTYPFEPEVLLEDVGRVTCAEAADLDTDGDQDIAVCVFGHNTGQVMWLEQKEDFVFAGHVLDTRPGAIHSFPFDADGDNDLDLAVALSQDSEEVLLFRNQGSGTFAKEVLFKADLTYYGLSGIELSDLDQDGDIDVLVTNGDTFAGRPPDLLKPYEVHGLAWLENDGTGHFTHQELVRHWGAYAVRAVDVDGDRDLDLVLGAHQIPEMFPEEPLASLIWLENDGAENFTRHSIEGNLPPLVITIHATDLNRDGTPEILLGSLDLSGGEAGHRLASFNVPHQRPGGLLALGIKDVPALAWVTVYVSENASQADFRMPPGLLSRLHRPWE